LNPVDRTILSAIFQLQFSFKIKIQDKKQQINTHIKPIEVPKLTILGVFWIYISNQTGDFFPKNRLDVYHPTIGLINKFTKLAAINTHWQPPQTEKDKPYIIV
jgi:hypothetical protein